jgi:hypothetical protein
MRPRAQGSARASASAAVGGIKDACKRRRGEHARATARIERHLRSNDTCDSVPNDLERAVSMHGRFTLYELTKLSNERLEHLIDTGVISQRLSARRLPQQR